MHLGLPVVFISAIVPLLVGFVWYHPKVLGTVWQKEVGLSDAQLQQANMLKIFGLTYLLSVMLSSILIVIVVHQVHLYSIFADNPDFGKEGTELNTWFKGFMDKYGGNFRTFKHGAFHGFLSGLMLSLAIVGVDSLFERRSAKYVFLHVGFWAISMMLMGGIISQWF